MRYVAAPEASSLDVWTYKEGLLSKVAHDLQIGATGLSVTATVEGDKSSLKVTAPVKGLRVRGAVKNGVTTPMSAKDNKDIEDSTTGTVLDAAKFPEIVYAAEGKWTAAGESEIAGNLTIKGTTKPLPLRVKVTDTPQGPKVEGEVRFKQTLFGVKPFSAMLGTLKVKDELRVTWSIQLKKE